MNREDAVKIIESREFISSPCAVNLRCTNVTFFEGKFIANFAAMTPYLLDKAVTLLDQDEFQAATNSSLSASLRATDFIPSKGEIVKVVVSEITTKNDVTGLFVTSVSELKAVKTSKVSLTKPSGDPVKFETISQESLADA